MAGRLLPRRRPDEISQRRAARGRADAATPMSAPRSKRRSSPGPISNGSATPGKARSSSRACTSATTRGARLTPAPTRSSSRTMAAGSWTMCTPRFGRCRRWSRRSRGRDRGAGGRRHPARQRRRQSAVPRRTSRARRARLRVWPRRRRRSGRHGARSKSCARTCCARSSCSDVRRRQRSIGRMSRFRTAGTSTPDRHSVFLQRSFTTRAPIPAIVKESELALYNF